MSAKPKPTTRKPGRPPTGETKTKPSLSIDIRLLKIAKKQAAVEKVSFSSWVEDALKTKMGGTAQ